MDPSVIAGGAFGQIWSFSTASNPSSVGLTEQFYAKLLVYTPSSFGRQVVLAFSEQNRIFVLDAVSGTLYRMRDLSNDATNPQAPFWVSDLGACNDISGTIGITGTPIIDNTTDTIYFWAKSYAVPGARGYQNGAYFFHAIDAWTLQEKPGFPTVVEGVPADNDKTRYFTGGNVLQRTSLNLIGNTVYAGFGGHCDLYNYTGWVVGMNKQSGSPVTLYSTAAGARAQPQDGTWNGGGGGCGIWQAGAALTSDNSNRLFFATGNGYHATVNGQSAASGRTHLDTLSECMVNMAIDPSTGLISQQDYFEPYTYAAIDSADRDLGSGGVSILPFSGGGVTSIAITCGKNGQCYITNADNMGGYKMGSGGSDGILQTITPPSGTAFFSSIGAYPSEGGYLYITPVGAPTYVYALGYGPNGKPSFSYAGSTPDSVAGRVGTGPATITTLGRAAGTAILWVSDPDNGIKAYYAVPNQGVLTKINLPATPVLSKFNRPAFGNGRYYTTTYQGQILGFGSPVQLPLNCGGPYNFGEVPIGNSTSVSITCTAMININKVTNVTAGNSLYTVDKSGIPTGAIAAGSSFTFSAAFNLTSYQLNAGSTSSPSVTPGSQSGSITMGTQNGATGYSSQAPISVTGQVVTSSPYAAINPAHVDFPPLVLGSAAAQGGSQSNMVIQNLGKSAMTILGYATTTDSPTSSSAHFTNITVNANSTSVLDSNRFFTSDDLPALNSEIATGSSIVVDLLFNCSTMGDFYTNLVVWTDGGMAYTVLTGSADSAPVALLEVSTAEGGWTTIPVCSPECTWTVDMGTSIGGLTTTEKTLRFTNNGGSDMIISKSKPPEGTYLGAENPNTDFSEGQVIKAGHSATAVLFFSPPSVALNSAPQTYWGAWTLNTDDLAFGLHVVNFTGTVQGNQVGPTLANGSPRFRHLGCYQDSTGGRVETGSTSLANNTNGACQSYAMGQMAAFAGTEYSTECWYGRSIPSDSLKVADYLCDTYACPGDSTQRCGGVGSYLLLWYDVTAYFPSNKSLSAAFAAPASKKTVGDYNYVGCMTDSTGSRALSGKAAGASNSQTLESCAAACAGYTYFGTEYSTECYCGNSIGSGSASALESTCSYTCAGDVTELCGGSSRISVYALNGTSGNGAGSGTTSSSSSSAAGPATKSSTSTTTSTTGAASAPAVVSTYWRYMGCETDSVSARTLQGASTQGNGQMTLEYCATYCVGYSYFGVEYASQCFCGNALANGAAAATDGRCNMACSGNSQNLCGGPNGLSLYQYNASLPVTSMTSSSASQILSTSSSTSQVLSTSTANGTSTISSTTSTASSSITITSSSSSSGTMSSSATTPSSTSLPLLTCPTANNTMYTSQNAKTFLLECYIDHFAGDLSLVYVSGYTACAEACSTTARCQAFSWQPGVSSPCYLKSSIGVGNPNNGVWGAKLVTLASSWTSVTSSSSSSSSSTTSLSTSTFSSLSTTAAIVSTSTSSSVSTSYSLSSTSTNTTSSIFSPISTTSSTSSSLSETSNTSSGTIPSSTTVSPTILSSASSSLTSSSPPTGTSSTQTSSWSSSSSAPILQVTSTSSTSSIISSGTSKITSSSASLSTLPISNTFSTSSSTPATTLSTSSTSVPSSPSSAPILQVSTTSSGFSTASSGTSTISTSSSTSAAPSTTSPTISSASSSTSSSTTLVSSTISSFGSSITSLSSSSSTSALPTPTPTLTSDWSYLGCANDSTSLRSLNGSTYTNTAMTVDSCQSYCSGKNYPLAGVEYSTQCYCGLGIAPGHALGQNGCTMTCGGNSSQTCGGKSRLSIWQNNTYVMPQVVQSVGALQLQGCFVDTTTARVLPKYTWTSSTSISVESCTAKCKSVGYAVSGVESGGECFCGASVPVASFLAANPYDCQVSFCSGNAQQFCGGSKRILVYA